MRCWSNSWSETSTTKLELGTTSTSACLYYTWKLKYKCLFSFQSSLLYSKQMDKVMFSFLLALIDKGSLQKKKKRKYIFVAFILLNICSKKTLIFFKHPLLCSPDTDELFTNLSWAQYTACLTICIRVWLQIEKWQKNYCYTKVWYPNIYWDELYLSQKI